MSRAMIPLVVLLLGATGASADDRHDRDDHDRWDSAGRHDAERNDRGCSGRSVDHRDWRDRDDDDGRWNRLSDRCAHGGRAGQCDRCRHEHGRHLGWSRHDRDRDDRDRFDCDRRDRERCGRDGRDWRHDRGNRSLDRIRFVSRRVDGRNWRSYECGCRHSWQEGSWRDDGRDSTWHSGRYVAARSCSSHR